MQCGKQYRCISTGFFWVDSPRLIQSQISLWEIGIATADLCYHLKIFSSWKPIQTTEVYKLLFLFIYWSSLCYQGTRIPLKINEFSLTTLRMGQWAFLLPRQKAEPGKRKCWVVVPAAQQCHKKQLEMAIVSPVLLFSHSRLFPILLLSSYFSLKLC